MAQPVSLLSYLQHAPPVLPTRAPRVPSANTANRAYNSEDITSVARWDDFTLATIMDAYRLLLDQTSINDEPMPVSPPSQINSENGLQARIVEYIHPRVRRALRASFLRGTEELQGRTPVSFDVGDRAALIDHYKPDTAFFDPRLPGTGPNRAPGGIKPSWKWKTSYRLSQVVLENKEYKQALSQVNYYMKQHCSRYGFILTDQELVVFKRSDAVGNLVVADAIPWDTQGTDAEPRLTVLLGLWYVGMLASTNNGPSSWVM